jgi:hypothetical protein
MVYSLVEKRPKESLDQEESNGYIWEAPSSCTEKWKGRLGPPSHIHTWQKTATKQRAPVTYEPSDLYLQQSVCPLPHPSTFSLGKAWHLGGKWGLHFLYQNECCKPTGAPSSDPTIAVNVSILYCSELLQQMAFRKGLSCLNTSCVLPPEVTGLPAFTYTPLTPHPGEMAGHGCYRVAHRAPQRRRRGHLLQKDTPPLDTALQLKKCNLPASAHLGPLGKVH